MQKRKIGLAVGILFFILVSFAVYEILVVAGFIQNKDIVSPENRASENQSASKQSPAKQTAAEQAPQADNIGSEKVTLAWDVVAEADSYNVYWDTVKGVTKHNDNKVSAVKNSATITGLKRGVTYYFVVTSVNESGESRESKELPYMVE